MHCPDYPIGTCAKLWSQLGGCGKNSEEAGGKISVLAYLAALIPVLLSAGVIVAVVAYQYTK